jgi:DNA-binding NarL/FixJ family response regulator
MASPEEKKFAAVCHWQGNPARGATIPKLNMGLAAKATIVPQKAAPVRILIADDSPFVRRAIRILLEANPGWEVCGEAANGQEALDRAMKLAPDIIILDLVMPVMDGLQAARRMAVIAPKTPTVMLSMHYSPQLESEASEAGVHTVLSKSESSALVSTIENLVRHRTC